MKQKFYFKKLLSTLAIAVVLLTPNFIYSQTPWCLTDETIASQRLNPTDTKNFQRTNPQPCDPNNPINIPLAFHFSQNSIDFCNDNFDCIFIKVIQQIDVLNEVFNDQTDIVLDCPSAYEANGMSVIPQNGACFNFYLAQPPTGSNLGINSLPITYGEFNGGYNHDDGNGAGAVWDSYLNIFVTEYIQIDGMVGGTGVSDWIPGEWKLEPNPKRPGDGVTISRDAFGGIGGDCAGVFDTNLQSDLGRTLAHEIGHYLGLLHTYSTATTDGQCGDEKDNYFNSSDVTGVVNITVNDTPRQTNDQTDCSTPNGCITACGGLIQAANMMSLGNDNCLDIFTADQIFAMQTVAKELYGTTTISPASSIINTDTEWSPATGYINNGIPLNTKYQPTDVIVKSGNTLTIKDLTIRFANNARIVVEKGAQLIVDKSTLTSICQQYIWPGIQVWGDPDFPHPASIIEQVNNHDNHGVVFIKNESRIEYAANAVKTTKVDNWGLPNQITDPTHENGIVIVSGDTDFYNNFCSIILWENDYDYTSSKVTDTEFEIDNLLFDIAFPPPGTGLPELQISLNNLNGYKMDNVHFLVRGDYLIDGTTDIPTGKAVAGHETTFTFENSSITNFSSGIEASFSLPGQNTQTKIYDNEFRNNEASITLTGYQDDFFDTDDTKEDINDIGLYIADNDIFLKQSGTPETNQEWGIRLGGCADYIVSNNTIKGGYVKSGDVLPCYGIMTYESSNIGTKANYVQKNTLGGVENSFNSKFHAGTYAWGDNPSLQILCNTYVDANMYSSIGLSDFEASFGVVAPLQGLCGSGFDTDLPETGPAGNTLADPDATVQGFAHSQINAMNLDQVFGFTYNDDAVVQSSVYGPVTFGSCANDVAECDAFTNEEVKGGEGGTDDDDDGGSQACCAAPLMRSDIETIESEMLQNMALLTLYNRKDYSVVINASTDIEHIKKVISAFDVYLSDKELMAITGKLNVVTAAAILNILEENGPLPDNVLQGLTNHINSLTLKERLLLKKNHQKQVNSLYENSGGLSLRKEKALEIYQLTVEQKYVMEVIPFDCCRLGPNSVAELFQFAASKTSLNKVWFQQQLVAYYIDQNELTLALKALEGINASKDTEVSDYVLLQKFRINLKLEGKNLYQLNNAEMDMLKQLAGTSSATGIIARNALLTATDSFPSYETPELPIPSAKEVNKPENPFLRLNAETNRLSVYPNPAKSELYINLDNLTIKPANLVVKIYAVNGALKQNINEKFEKLKAIDITSLSQGTYFVEVLDDRNHLVDRSKFVVIH